MRGIANGLLIVALGTGALGLVLVPLFGISGAVASWLVGPALVVLVGVARTTPEGGE